MTILAVFTSGSAVGLVTLSHLLSYVLRRFNHIATAIIIGFISGSLGVVWPWKKTMFKTLNGTMVTDSNGNGIITNYERYFPDLSDLNTWIAVFFIIFGIGIFCLLYTSPSPRDKRQSRMPSSA